MKKHRENSRCFNALTVTKTTSLNLLSYVDIFVFVLIEGASSLRIIGVARQLVLVERLVAGVGEIDFIINVVYTAFAVCLGQFLFVLHSLFPFLVFVFLFTLYQFFMKIAIAENGRLSLKALTIRAFCVKVGIEFDRQ